MSGSLRSLLADLVAPGSLLPEEEGERWGVEGRTPAAVLAPASQEEVGLVLERASGEGWTVLPAGYGQWPRGGGAVAADLVISTQRIREVIHYEAADLTFTAGAGISLNSLAEATGAHGQWLPLDPPGGHHGSLGAAVATGVSGPLRHWFGSPRDHLLGLTVVSGDGRILRWGGRVVKNVAGFDVTRLCIGSWGALGVITSVSARLFPLPEVDVTVVVDGPDAFSLLPLGRVVALSSLPLAAVELLDPLGGVRGKGGKGAGLVVRLLGSRAEVAAMEERVRQEAGIGEAMERLEGEESRGFHRRLQGWEDGAHLVFRLAALPSQLDEVLSVVKGWESPLRSPQGLREGDMRVAAHVGAGILRVAITGISAENGGTEDWTRAIRRLREGVEELGGSLVLSSGPTALEREVGVWGGSGRAERVLRALKREFDPQGILVPGRMTG
jgi:glycolate oxidase FAD binding subunit